MREVVLALALKMTLDMRRQARAEQVEHPVCRHRVCRQGGQACGHAESALMRALGVGGASQESG